MADPRVSANIGVGQLVLIAERKNQKDGSYIEGKVIEIIDDQSFNEEGIEVRLDNGHAGWIKAFPNEDDWPPSESLLHEKIRMDETPNFELKASFNYIYQKIDEGKEKPNLPLELAREIAAFFNSVKGGMLCIGVHAKTKEILGLENDYKLLSGGNHEPRDELEIQIRDSLRKYLNRNDVPVKIDIKFYELDGKDVCLLHVKPFTMPVFVRPSKNQRLDLEFRVLEGTSKKLITNIEDVLTYWIAYKQKPSTK